MVSNPMDEGVRDMPMMVASSKSASLVMPRRRRALSVTRRGSSQPVYSPLSMRSLISRPVVSAPVMLKRAYCLV